MSLQLLRAPLTLLSTYCFYYSLTPPNPPVSDDERPSEKLTGWEKSVGSLVLLWPLQIKAGALIGGIYESAIILASQFPAPPLTDHILSNSVVNLSSISSIRITPTFLAGVFLTTLGAAIRNRCYRELGKLFTFELSIRKDHKLVTSGPYSIVRHPSYTAAALACVGTAMCLVGPGSWLREGGVLSSLAGKAVVGSTLVSGVTILLYFIPRTVKEDKMLREEFGEQWDRWAEKVRYRLMPYVF